MGWMTQLNLDELESTVTSHAEYAVARSSTYDEAGAEMAINAFPTTYGFGIGGSMWDRLKAEFRLLVCEKHPKYSELREKLDGLADQSTSALIAAVSAGLGATLGATASVIAPMVALLLLAAVRLGIEVLCSGEELAAPVRIDQTPGAGLGAAK